MQALRGIVTALGRDADDTMARASAAQTQDGYRAATDRARQLGLFGSPTFVAGQEIFWGDDRLEDALAWCAAQGGRESP
jgi:2-hydroxychromene-2-carboxylate isomerase